MSELHDEGDSTTAVELRRQNTLMHEENQRLQAELDEGSCVIRDLLSSSPPASKNEELRDENLRLQRELFEGTQVIERLMHEITTLQAEAVTMNATMIELEERAMQALNMVGGSGVVGGRGVEICGEAGVGSNVTGWVAFFFGHRGKNSKAPVFWYI